MPGYIFGGYDLNHTSPKKPKIIEVEKIVHVEDNSRLERLEEQKIFQLRMEMNALEQLRERLRKQNEKIELLTVYDFDIDVVEDF